MAKNLMAELQKLRAKRELLEKKENELLARSNAEIIAKIVAQMRENQISIAMVEAALNGGATMRVKKTRSVASKIPRKLRQPGKTYTNPENAAETWAGLGRPPAWVVKLKAAGTLESAAVSS